MNKKLDKIKEVISDIKKGKRLILAWYYYRQEDGRCPDIEIYYNENKYIYSYINCENGVEGTCNCNSHEMIIEKEYSESEIVEFLMNSRYFDNNEKYDIEEE